MSWWVVVWLSLGAYAFKVLGFVVIGSRKLPRPLERCLLLIPAALLAALVVKDTFSTQQTLAVDERAVGLAVALLCVWRKRSLVATVVAAATATALLRAI
jgi:branched-subunit amino acid transport protein